VGIRIRARDSKLNDNLLADPADVVGASFIAGLDHAAAVRDRKHASASQIGVERGRTPEGE